MTVTRDVTVWCDHGYEPETGYRACHQWMTAETAAQVRIEAKANGWRHARGPARDYCRSHAPTDRRTA